MYIVALGYWVNREFVWWEWFKLIGGKVVWRWKSNINISKFKLLAMKQIESSLYLILKAFLYK